MHAVAKIDLFGMYPHQHGSLTNRHGKPMEIAGSMLDYFKRRGYRLGYIGKNHAYEMRL